MTVKFAPVKYFQLPMLKINIFLLTMLFIFAHARRFKRAVGGEPLKSGQYPFFAYLILPDESFTAYLCSASLIHPKWILTSADCFPSTPEGIFGIERLGVSGIYTVYMGTMEVSNSSIYPNCISKLHIHPEFYKEKLKSGWNITFNIALAELRWKYNLTNFVNTVYLPWPRNPIKRCETGKVISIGPTSWCNQSKSSCVNVVLIRVRDTLKEIRNPSATMFYSQAVLGSRHVLEADVGAPFVCYPDPENEGEVVQYGVISGTMNTTRGSMITLIENVEKYMDFIVKHVKVVKYCIPRKNISPRIQAVDEKESVAPTTQDEDTRLMYANCLALLYWFVVTYLVS